ATLSYLMITTLENKRLNGASVTTGLYETIYQFDNPQTFEAWREATLRRQSQWFHMQARKNLDKFQSPPRRSNTGHRAFQIPGRHPDAMDTSADRSRAP